jgi:hypothetical protein
VLVVEGDMATAVLNAARTQGAALAVIATAA